MSPNKTLYIRDEDIPVWERAEQVSRLIKLSASQLATSGLRRLLFPKSPRDIKVFVSADDVDDITFADSDGAPLLIFKRHAEHGMGWVLYTYDGDDYFIAGGLGDVESALGTARSHLQRKSAPEMETITVDVGEPNRKVGFIGRWLVEPHFQETRSTEAGYDAGAYWGVARTKRGRIAVYTAHCNEAWPATLNDYDGLDAAAQKLPENILADAKAALGEEYFIMRDI